VKTVRHVLVVEDDRALCAALVEQALAQERTVDR
jgi:hypothetical protein